MQHDMHLHPVQFEKVKTGQKTIELRVNDPKRQAVQAGDIIVFHNRADASQSIAATVRQITAAKSFEELSHLVPAAACGYDSAAELLQAMASTPFFTAEEVAEHGVVGFHLQLL